MAQQSNQTIHLKDGSKIIGTVLSIDPDGIITIQSEDLPKLRINSSSVSSIGFEGKNNVYSNDYYSFETSILVNKNRSNASIHLSYHHLLNPNFDFGVGMGVDVYDYVSGSLIFPLYVSLGTSTNSDLLSPFASLNLGYGLTTKDSESNVIDSQGGLMVNPKFGLKMNNNKFGVSFFTGFKFQKATYIYEVGNGEFEEKNTFKRLEFGIGFNI